MIVLGAFLLFIAVTNWKRTFPILCRLSAIGLFSAVITSYFWVPFIREQEFLRGTANLEEFRPVTPGALDVFSRLLSGQMFDHNRLPVLTLLLGLGIASAIGRRSRQSRVALVLGTVWLMLYSGRPVWGALIDLLPMHEGLPIIRFKGGVDLATILLIGVGGEWLWMQFAFLGERWRPIVPTAIVLLILVPPLIERHAYYAKNSLAMKDTQAKFESDSDWQTIQKTLETLPPGRTYAGQRSRGWGRKPEIGSLRAKDLLNYAVQQGRGRRLKIGSLNAYDLLIFDDFDTLAPPYQGMSLNADFAFRFDETNVTMYNLFNVRYVVAPSEQPMAPFLTSLKTTPTYTLYQVNSIGGYGELVKSMNPGVAASRQDLFQRNLAWLNSDAPTNGNFIRWSYPLGEGQRSGEFHQDASADGSVTDQEFKSGLIRLRVTSATPSLLVIKTTYHPNWRVTVDRHPAETFMTSPSFIGVPVPAGDHLILAEYLSGRLKKFLLIAGALALLAALSFKHRFDRLEFWLHSKLASH